MKSLGKFTVILFLLIIGTVTNVKGNTTNAITYGEVQRGRLTGPTQTNFYTFTGTSGEVISLAVLRTNAIGDAFIFLYDPVGELVLVGNGNSGLSQLAYFHGVHLNETGVYTLLVVDGGLDQAYDYLLSLTRVVGGGNLREAGDGAEAIAPGQITSGHLGLLDMDTFTFSAASNDVITVALLRTNVIGDAYLYLYDPAGEEVFLGLAIAGYRNWLTSTACV